MSELELGDWVRVVGYDFKGHAKHLDKIGVIVCTRADSEGDWWVRFSDDDGGSISYFQAESLEAVPDPKMEAFKARVVEVIRRELMRDTGDPILESLGILPKPVRRSVTFEFDQPALTLVDPMDVVNYLKHGIQFHTSNITCIPDTIRGDK